MPSTATPDMLELVQLGDEVHMYEPRMRMRFDRSKAAAYQLLHVLLHELGHHVDAITKPRIGRCVRGEGNGRFARPIASGTRRSH